MLQHIVIQHYFERILLLNSITVITSDMYYYKITNRQTAFKLILLIILV